MWWQYCILIRGDVALWWCNNWRNTIRYDWLGRHYILVWCLSVCQKRVGSVSRASSWRGQARDGEARGEKWERRRVSPIGFRQRQSRKLQYYGAPPLSLSSEDDGRTARLSNATEAFVQTSARKSSWKQSPVLSQRAQDPWGIPDLHCIIKQVTDQWSSPLFSQDILDSKHYFNKTHSILRHWPYPQVHDRNRKKDLTFGAYIVKDVSTPFVWIECGSIPTTWAYTPYHVLRTVIDFVPFIGIPDLEEGG